MSVICWDVCFICVIYEKYSEYLQNSGGITSAHEWHQKVYKWSGGLQDRRHETMTSVTLKSSCGSQQYGPRCSLINSLIINLIGHRSLKSTLERWIHSFPLTISLLLSGTLISTLFSKTCDVNELIFPQHTHCNEEHFKANHSCSLQLTNSISFIAFLTMLSTYSVLEKVITY